MTRVSALHDEHVRLGATMVDFAGWQMPVRYSGDTAEHGAVRTAAGLFDLSHMGEIMVRGPEASAALDYATVGRLSEVDLWAAKYTMLCREDGGVLDDVVVYRRDWDHYMVVANAANTVTVMAELTQRLQGFEAWIEDETESIALVAIQGPAAAGIVTAMCELGAEDIDALRYYRAANVLLVGGVHAFVARTGYTGEDGFELCVPAHDAEATWRLALAMGEPAGLMPCGLSARDSLRLEAGMPLYGQELTVGTNPYEAGLERIVQWGPSAEERGDFVGRAALEHIRAEGPGRVLVGLAGESRRGPRTGYSVADADGHQVGIVTSGIPSPTLGHAIAMAYVPPVLAKEGTVVNIDVRGRHEQMTVVSLPFYRRQR